MSESPMARAVAAAQEMFKYPGLRPFQERVFRYALFGRDCFVVAPTGAGKTALFGIPSLVMDGLVIVVSPLIALMKNQADAMDNLGIAVCRLTGDMGDNYIRSCLSDLSRFNLVFVSPEKATTKDFLKALKNIEVSMIAVDEAHAVASLYSTFRASCAHLGELFDAHPGAVRLACTATADPHIEEDIYRICHLRSPIRLIESAWRENIEWEFVFNADYGDLANLVEDYQSREGTQLVYVSSRNSAREICAYLQDEGLSVDYYHAGLSDSLRRTVQENFTRQEVRCIVATSAFGMGIDVPNIRLVANYQLPSSLFDLLQQAGRGSRDGAPAKAWVNLGKDADKTQNYFRLLGNPEWAVYRRLWDAFSETSGPTRWRGDVLLRKAGVGDKLAGQLSSALAYMEFRRAIKTSPAGHVYVMPVIDATKAARLCAAMPGARLVKDRVIYSVPVDGIDNAKVFSANRACTAVDPVDSLIVTRLCDELPFTSDDVDARADRAYDVFHAIYEFYKANDRKAFIESVMSK